MASTVILLPPERYDHAIKFHRCLLRCAIEQLQNFFSRDKLLNFCTGGGWDIPSLMAASNPLGQNSPGERIPQLSFPFGQFDSMPQQTPPPPLPLGSKTFFGLNFDLPPLPLLEQNGDVGSRHASTSEPEFKRARIDPPLGKALLVKPLI